MEKFEISLIILPKMKEYKDELEKKRPLLRGRWQVWGWLLSLDFDVNIFYEFLLINFVEDKLIQEQKL